MVSTRSNAATTLMTPEPPPAPTLLPAAEGAPLVPAVALCACGYASGSMSMAIHLRAARIVDASTTSEAGSAASPRPSPPPLVFPSPSRTTLSPLPLSSWSSAGSSTWICGDDDDRLPPLPPPLPPKLALPASRLPSSARSAGASICLIPEGSCMISSEKTRI